MNNRKLQYWKTLQNRSFVKFLRYCKIEILTYVKYAPVSILLWSWTETKSLVLQSLLW